MKKYFTILTIILSSLNLNAADRFLQKIKVSPKATAVVEEGVLEAASTGSFSVRLYSSANAQPGDDTTFYTDGLIQARDGAIEEIALVDIDRDKVKEIVVLVRSAGTGRFISAHAFTVKKGKISLLCSMAGLPQDNALFALIKAYAAKLK